MCTINTHLTDKELENRNRCRCFQTGVLHNNLLFTIDISIAKGIRHKISLNGFMSMMKITYEEYDGPSHSPDLDPLEYMWEYTS